ncbi:unnamed protein product [Parnassius apollo]|uniref:XK-related protein n=1 Tax=Parnassius apollo TaxID=110799 RepID=A0A8S3Y8M9_PARAO|nr:unnamed protein product [Parnassius apollo]
MVVCELDKEVSGEILGKKLSVWQALLLHRVLPSWGGLVVYMTVICFDMTLIYEHFRNGDDAYCYLIFWWTEGVFASYAEDEERIEEALLFARAPSPLELYLFLQAFIHSAPHAIVNILDLMLRVSDPTYGKVSVQAVSIIASCMRMASTATLYRRFEREKICGRKYPWGNAGNAEKDNVKNEGVEKRNEDNNVSEHIYEPIKRQSSSSNKSTDSKNEANNDLIQFSPRNSEMTSSLYEDSAFDSDTSSNYLSPITLRDENTGSDNEYVRPISIVDKVAPLRQKREYVIENVYVPPPPVMDAPRPGSLALWAEKIVENAENIPTWLSAPPRRKHWEVVQDEPDIPRRVPRSFIRGLEPQDITAGLVQYLGWYSFFVSRLLSISAFINFFPYVAIIILFSHYQVMLLFLIVPQASTVKRAFYMFLAFIYLFCLMEFKIRFRHVRVWHAFWLIACTIENIIFIALWASIDNYFDSWWRRFVVIVTFGSMLLSYMCLLVYFVLLKPRETVVPIKNSKVSASKAL